MNSIVKVYLVILLPLGLWSCNPKPEPETFLIPQGFTGRVNVIFNRKDGAPPKYENNQRIYEIPESGILLTQFKDQYGFIDHQYYYVDSDGKRTSLQIFNDTVSMRNRDIIGVFLNGTTGQYGDLPSAVWWQEFVVSSYKSLGDYFTPEYKKGFEDKLKKATGVQVVIP